MSIKAILFLWLFSFGVRSFALPDSGFKNIFYELNGLTLEERVIGRNCFSLSSSGLGASCNPAHLAELKESQLRVNFILDQDFEKVIEADKKLSSNRPEDLIHFLNQNQGCPNCWLISANIWYQNKNGWRLSYTHLRGGMVS